MSIKKYQQQFITLPITKYVEILFVFVRTHLCLRRQPSTNTIAKPPSIGYESIINNIH